LAGGDADGKNGGCAAATGSEIWLKRRPKYSYGIRGNHIRRDCILLTVTTLIKVMMSLTYIGHDVTKRKHAYYD
jgi:hypothetical protein